jgi:hypothetical protein
MLGCQLLGEFGTFPLDIVDIAVTVAPAEAKVHEAKVQGHCIACPRCKVKGMAAVKAEPPYIIRLPRLWYMAYTGSLVAVLAPGSICKAAVHLHSLKALVPIVHAIGPMVRGHAHIAA